MKKLFQFIWRLIFVPVELVLGISLLSLVYVVANSHIPEPQVPKIKVQDRVKTGENTYSIGKNWLRKNKFGIWEMYVEGKPFERGLIYGKLAKELVQKQEKIFVAQIEDFVPSSFMRAILQTGLSFANKDLINNIQAENLQEIYGVSLSFSDEYNYIAPKYTRILNYHAAHDIGHALNDYAIVGCTSFAVEGDKTADGELLVGRNFDFYVGDAFAEEKILLFVNPDQGYKFASYSWAGFTGVASGLNEQGLSVTINASKSAVPTASKTPIALVAREILQYASTIDEAIAIAKKRDVFVSESILVSSAKDHKAGLIEKGPGKTGIYFSPSNTLICANHFQSTTFKNSAENLSNIRNSDSKTRFREVERLLQAKNKLELEDIAEILRNTRGDHGEDAGLGNPGTINQLQGHHSVIFQPSEKQLWVSTVDYQLGPYISYNLTDFFRNATPPMSYDSIPSDPLRFSAQYRNYLTFRTIKQKIFRFTHFGEKMVLKDKDVSDFIALNPQYYGTYQLIGDYFAKLKKHQKAAYYYHLSQQKFLPSKAVRKELIQLESSERRAAKK